MAIEGIQPVRREEYVYLPNSLLGQTLRDLFKNIYGGHSQTKCIDAEYGYAAERTVVKSGASHLVIDRPLSSDIITACWFRQDKKPIAARIQTDVCTLVVGILDKESYSELFVYARDKSDQAVILEVDTARALAGDMYGRFEKAANTK